MDKLEKREKVINGLECCAIDGGCGACPYDSFKDCTGSHPTPETLMKDALALLQAQEPRVMTLDLPPAEWHDKAIWLEIKGKEPTPCLFREYTDRMMFGRYERLMCFDVVGSSRESGYMLKNYGIKWRCWTSRPTEAEREAIPWN